MENIRVGYIPVGQVVRKNYKTLRIWKFIKNNKIKLLISLASTILIMIYAKLIINFINLLQLLNK